MKTEVYILLIHNPDTGRTATVSRPTRYERCEFLLEKVAPEFWDDNSKAQATRALAAYDLDLFEVIAKYGLKIGFEITKRLVDVKGQVSKLKRKLKQRGLKLAK